MAISPNKFNNISDQAYVVSRKLVLIYYSLCFQSIYLTAVFCSIHEDSSPVDFAAGWHENANKDTHTFIMVV
jgi:hypothetical protein